MSAMIYRLFNGDPFRSVSTSVPVRQDRALRKRGSFKRSRELNIALIQNSKERHILFLFAFPRLAAKPRLNMAASDACSMRRDNDDHRFLSVPPYVTMEAMN